MLLPHLQKLSIQESYIPSPLPALEGKGSWLQLCQLRAQLLHPSVPAAQGQGAIVYLPSLSL